MNLQIFITTALFLLTISSCGKNSSSSLSSSTKDPLVGEEVLVKDLLRSFSRHQLAILSWGLDEKMKAMTEIIYKGLPDSNCRIHTNSEGAKDRIEGNDCAINWNNEITSRVHNSEAFEGVFDYSLDVNNESYRMLCDVDQYRLKGEVKKHIEDGFQLFTKSQKGSIRSQQNGLVVLEQNDELRTSYMWADPQKIWGDKKSYFKISPLDGKYSHEV